MKRTLSSTILLSKKLLILLIGLILNCTASAETSFQEYDVKAGYLRHIGTFTRWPIGAFHNNESPFSICILGNAPFSDAMIKAMNSKQIQRRKLKVQHIARIGKQAEQCQILFISQSEISRVQTILQWAKTRPILTVSDIDNFARLGGMIEMATIKKSIVLIIHLPISRNNGLIVSSELLSLARVIKG